MLNKFHLSCDLCVIGGGLSGMAAAIAATCCIEPVTILNAEAVKKSYPAFWQEYKKLGGYYEQYLR